MVKETGNRSHRTGLDHAGVVEEAAKLVDEEGIAALSLSHLAERLGIRTPSLYNYVAGLAGLKHDLALHCLRDLLDRVTRATIGKARAEAIFALAEGYQNYARETPGRYALTLQAPDPEDAQIQAAARQVVNVIQAVLAPYKLGDEDAIHAIRGLRSIVHGFLSLEAAGGFGIPIDLNASFHWLITMFIAGLERPADAL